MLERSILRHGASVATATAAATGSMPTTKVASKPRGSLLGYPLRETAAYEMLYGGVRVRGLVTPAFPLHFLKSEELPGPSLSRERRDLEIEMQLPQSFNVYDNVNLAVQRLVGRQLPAHAGTEEGPTGPPTQKRDKKAFDMGSFYSVHHHAERHHNSSLPYAPGDTNNVLAMRLFPVNVGQRLRVECVRIRTEDCMKRLQAQKLAGAVGRRMQFPLPLATEQVLKKEAERRTKGGLTSTLYSGALNPADWQSLGENQMGKDCASYAHLRGAAFHPPSHELSIFTRPSDQGIGAGSPRGKPAAVADSHWELPQRSGYRSSEWMPLQMIKPIQHNWSPGIRSSGSRGPHMQLRQERLDQKGFGWKKKSRSLWQQDIATAGFRPHRFY